MLLTKKNVPGICEQLRKGNIWNSHGEIRPNTFTCEDFAVRVLCSFAAANGLPVKLTTGVRTYRNMERYDAKQHAAYPSNVHGFAQMVMLTYGAPDMQRTGVNTLPVKALSELSPGDILARENDRANRVAHHIQLVTSVSENIIRIHQGNSGTGNWSSLLFRIFGHNPANPSDDQYTGKPVETGEFVRGKSGWDYVNLATGKKYTNLLEQFGFYRWNFQGFNK